MRWGSLANDPTEINKDIIVWTEFLMIAIRNGADWFRYTWSHQEAGKSWPRQSRAWPNDAGNLIKGMIMFTANHYRNAFG